MIKEIKLKEKPRRNRMSQSFLFSRRLEPSKGTDPMESLDKLELVRREINELKETNLSIELSKTAPEDNE